MFLSEMILLGFWEKVPAAFLLEKLLLGKLLAVVSCRKAGAWSPDWPLQNFLIEVIPRFQKMRFRNIAVLGDWAVAILTLVYSMSGLSKGRLQYFLIMWLM